MFENKKKFALWVYPDTLEKIENIYREDDCESKSEFIEKAINFYIGYLTTEDKKNYLPSIVTSTLKAIVDSSDTRQNRMMFKLGGGDRYRAESHCRYPGHRSRVPRTTAR